MGFLCHKAKIYAPLLIVFIIGALGMILGLGSSVEYRWPEGELVALDTLAGVSGTACG